MVGVGGGGRSGGATGHDLDGGYRMLGLQPGGPRLALSCIDRHHDRPCSFSSSVDFFLLIPIWFSFRVSYVDLLLLFSCLSLHHHLQRKHRDEHGHKKDHRSHDRKDKPFACTDSSRNRWGASYVGWDDTVTGAPISGSTETMRRRRRRRSSGKSLSINLSRGRRRRGRWWPRVFCSSLSVLVSAVRVVDPSYFPRLNPPKTSTGNGRSRWAGRHAGPARGTARTTNLFRRPPYLGTRSLLRCAK